MTIYLGLGSNLGDRQRQLREAIRALAQSNITVTRSASIYATAPKDAPPGAPWFLNTVVEAQTTQPPRQLIETCLAIERSAGRIRSEPNAPRSLDIDVLLIDNMTLDIPGLIVPHPRYAERRFVLVPLAEIAPNLLDPVRRCTIRELLDSCQDPEEVRWFAPGN